MIAEFATPDCDEATKVVGAAHFCSISADGVKVAVVGVGCCNDCGVTVRMKPTACAARVVRTTSALTTFILLVPLPSTSNEEEESRKKRQEG